jgi:hypothetical protein
MSGGGNGARLLSERAIAGDMPAPGPGSGGRPLRSVTFNAAESPLGWLFARGHLSRRQMDAGERLRADWERGPAATARYDGVGLSPCGPWPWRLSRGT